MTLSNLLPRDTRAIELLAAASMILNGFGIAVGVMSAEILTSISPPEFWGILFVMSGMVQVYAVAEHPQAELIRAGKSLLNGAVLIWMSLDAIFRHVEPCAISNLLLGASSLYAFSLSFLLLRRAWEK